MSMQNAREVVLPLAMVIGLIANVLVVGVAWGRLGERLDGLREQAAESKKSINLLQYEIVELKLKLATGGKPCPTPQ